MTHLCGHESDFCPHLPPWANREENSPTVLRAESRLGTSGPPQVQYTFIYQALLEYYLYGDTELDVSSLERHLQTLHGTATHFDKIGLEEEFRVSGPSAPPPGWAAEEEGQW